MVGKITLAEAQWHFQLPADVWFTAVITCQPCCLTQCTVVRWATISNGV